ncbi:MAG: ROK family protein [Clostridia bacterium]|nr:ROK family protein [Clostridia bacterium]
MFRLGFDIGGTNFKFALIKDYEILEKSSFFCDEIIDNFQICQKIKEQCDFWKEKYSFQKFDFIGIGVPGEVAENKIIKTPNLKFDIKNLPYKIEKIFKQEVQVENDAVCAGIYDYLSIKNKPKAMLSVTLGTGIGGSLIYNNKIYVGAGFAPLEIGHMVIEKDGINCNCGQRGCFEKYASISSMIDYYQDKTDEFKTAEEILSLYLKNDNESKKTIERFVNYLSLGLTNLVNILSPDMIIISGSFSSHMEPLMEKIREIVKLNKYSKDDDLPKIKLSKAGANAGLLGAAYLDFKKI